MIPVLIQLVTWGSLALTALAVQQNGSDKTANDSWDLVVRHAIGESDRAQTGTIKNVLLLNSDRQALTCGLDGTVCLWDLQAGKIVRRFEDPECDSVYCMALLDNERKLLTGGDGPAVNLWNLETGERIKQFEKETTVFSMAVLPDEVSFVCGDSAGNVFHQELDSGKSQTYRQDSSDITALTLTPDHQGFVTGNGSGNVHLWRFERDEPTAEFEGLGGWVCCLRYSEDGTQLLGSDYSGNVTLWQSDNREQVWKQEELAGDICWGHFLDDDSLIVVDTDDAFYVLDRRTGGARKKDIVLPEAAGFDVSEDRTTAWCGGNHVLCGWDIETGKRVFPDDETMRMARSVASAAMVDNRIYFSSDRPPVSVWNLTANTPTDVIHLSEKLKIDWDEFRFSPASGGMLAHSPRGFVITDFSTGEAIAQKKIRNLKVIASSRAGFVLYLPEGGGTVRELNVESGEDSLLFSADDGSEFRDIITVDDDHIIAVVDGYPEKLMIWSVTQKAVIRNLEAEQGFQLLDVAGKVILGINDDQKLVVFASTRHPAGILDEATIDELISDLDSGDYAVRTTATQQLIRGGTLTLARLKLSTPQSVEARVRIKKILASISNSHLPGLEKPLEVSPPLDREIETGSIDPGGRFLLATMRTGWQSELLLFALNENACTLTTRIPLRSRATTIRAAADRENFFVVGYADGTLDVVEVLNSNPAGQ